MGSSSSSEEIVLQPFGTTWLVEAEPIDPVTHPPEAPPPGEVLVDSLFYRADLLVLDTALGAGPMNIGLRVRLRNPFDDPVRITIPGCPQRPRVYATVDRVDPPFWHPSLDDLGLGGCALPVANVTVPPREEITGIFAFFPSDLAGSLPDGRYYFTMEFHRVAKELLLFPVGSADVRYREPGLEFDVTLEETGERVRVEVGVTNRNDVPMLLEWGHCSLNLALYRDAARSDLAMEGRPLNTCFDFLRRETVAPGETIRPDEFTREADPTCTYTAEATDGIPPYSYQWFIDGDSVEVGGDEEEIEIDDVGEDDFLLEVRVQDSWSGGWTWDDILVDVSPNHSDCEPSL